jgi:DNA-binding transcriptional ArsR family regulator
MKIEPNPTIGFNPAIHTDIVPQLRNYVKAEIPNTNVHTSSEQTKKLIVDFLKERYSKRTEETEGVDDMATLSEISSYLGLTKQTVSRYLYQLYDEKPGFIQVATVGHARKCWGNEVGLPFKPGISPNSLVFSYYD